MKEQSIQRYPVLWRALHWVSAAVILWAIASGFYILMARPTEQVLHAIADFNVAVTLLFVPLFALRLVMTMCIPKPDTPQLADRQKKLANKAHAVMYLTVSIVLLSGVLMMERSMSIFGLVELSAVFYEGIVTHCFFVLHRVANIVLLLLIVAHLLAVVKHQLNGIPVLKKML